MRHHAACIGGAPMASDCPNSGLHPAGFLEYTRPFLRRLSICGRLVVDQKRRLIRRLFSLPRKPCLSLSRSLFLFLCFSPKIPPCLLPIWKDISFLAEKCLTGRNNESISTKGRIDPSLNISVCDCLISIDKKRPPSLAPPDASSQVKASNADIRKR